jgi:hypothetical protein
MSGVVCRIHHIREAGPKVRVRDTPVFELCLEAAIYAQECGIEMAKDHIVVSTVSTSGSYKQTTASGVHRVFQVKYSILSWLGTRRTENSKTSVRHRIDPATAMASPAALKKFQVAPETKDKTDFVVSELRRISCASRESSEHKLTISGSSFALFERCMIV